MSQLTVETNVRKTPPLPTTDSPCAFGSLSATPLRPDAENAFSHARGGGSRQQDIAAGARGNSFVPVPVPQQARAKTRAASSQQASPVRAKAWTTRDQPFEGRFGFGRLTPLREVDAEWIYENLFSNKDVLRWYRDGKGRSLEETREFISERAARWEAGYVSGWLVRVGEEPAGYLGCDDTGTGKLEIGYAFAPKFWGNGLGTVSVFAALSYLRRVETPFSYLIATAHPDNAGSNAVLQKVGFTLSGRAQRLDYDGATRNYYFLAREDLFRPRHAPSGSNVTN